MYDNRSHVQSQFATVIALDSVQVTPWECLRTNRGKPRNGGINTNAILMDFRVDRHVLVTDEVDDAG